jgi:hypothetical protein
MAKWKNKFAKSIKEREMFKKDFAKTQELTCLTRNTNIRTAELDAIDLSNKAGTESKDPKRGGSLFTKVLKRRKSRQSTFAPCNIDFDYAGNS